MIGHAFNERLNRINLLVEAGILGREACPEYYYWHWPVLKPDELPDEFAKDHKEFGEVRLA